MKPYLLSLAAGLLVGVIYSLVHVRSPAPPVIALVGLLGILVGEQIPPLVKQLIPREAMFAWFDEHVMRHVLWVVPRGTLASRAKADEQVKS